MAFSNDFPRSGAEPLFPVAVESLIPTTFIEQFIALFQGGDAASLSHLTGRELHKTDMLGKADAISQFDRTSQWKRIIERNGRFRPKLHGKFATLPRHTNG